MNKLNIKTITCDCGCAFTIPKERNDVFDEHKIDPHKEAIIKENDTYIVLYCPDCNKETNRWYK